MSLTQTVKSCKSLFNLQRSFISKEVWDGKIVKSKIRIKTNSFLNNNIFQANLKNYSDFVEKTRSNYFILTKDQDYVGSRDEKEQARKRVKESGPVGIGIGRTDRKKKKKEGKIVELQRKIYEFNKKIENSKKSYENKCFLEYMVQSSSHKLVTKENVDKMIYNAVLYPVTYDQTLDEVIEIHKKTAFQVREKVADFELELERSVAPAKEELLEMLEEQRRVEVINGYQKDSSI